MKLAPSFYRTVAVCSILSAVTTLGLIFLPEFYQPAEGFEGRMRRVDDPAYELRSWVYLVHPFITFAAALGVGLRIRALRPVAAIIGIAGFALWASNEAIQQTMTLFAFDTWRAAYFAADEATRAIIRTNVAMYDGLWDAFYFLLLIGFSIGNFSLGVGTGSCGSRRHADRRLLLSRRRRDHDSDHHRRAAVVDDAGTTRQLELSGNPTARARADRLVAMDGRARRDSAAGSLPRQLIQSVVAPGQRTSV